MTNNNGNGKEPKGSLEGLSEKAYEIARRRQAAAIETVTMLEDHYETVFESRAASLLQAAAWLAGYSLRRSFESDGHGEGDSPAANSESNEQLRLMKAFMFLVDKYGIKLKANDYATEIPPEHKIYLSPEEIEGKFVAPYDEIMQKHGFDYADGARTGAVVCARLVRLHCANRKDLEPQVAASIVTMGLMEGDKGRGA